MFRFYKKHIALFFALLFVVSQLHYVVHSVFEHHHEGCEHTHNTTQEVTSEVYKTFNEKTSFNEVHDCTLCQQFQNTKLQLAQVFNLELANLFNNTYKPVLFNRLLSSNFLLDDISLRGPPTTV